MNNQDHFTWQPIASAPRDTRVLVHEAGSVHVATWVADFFADGGAWVICDLRGGGGMAYVNKPTHWMPCPELPAMEAA